MNAVILSKRSPRRSPARITRETERKRREGVSSSFIAIMGSYNGIKETMDVFREAVASGQFNIKDMTDGLIPTINNVILDMQQLMIKTDSIMEQYERSPSDLLFKQQEIKTGPGE